MLTSIVQCTASNRAQSSSNKNGNVEIESVSFATYWCNSEYKKDRTIEEKKKNPGSNPW